MSVPIFCISCGNLFESRAIRVVDSKNVTFVGWKEPCPKCGKTAQVLEGTYSFYDDVVEVIKGTSFTKDAVLKLKNLVNKTQSSNDLNNPSHAKEFIDIISAVDERAGKTMQNLIKASPKVSVPTLIALVFFIVLYFPPNVLKPTLDKSGEIIRDKIFTPDKPNDTKNSN